MKKNLFTAIVVLIASQGCSQKQEKSFVEWAKEEAIVISTFEMQDNFMDIDPLRKIVGKSKLVCLGESRHDIHEQFVLKNRFIKYLVEEMGFKAFILEASLPYSEKINDFLKEGIGDFNEIMSGMPGWFLWDTEEMRDIIQWMKEYNEQQEDDNKLQFFGIDIVAPAYALDRVFNYLIEIDSDYYWSIIDDDFAIQDIDDNYWQNTSQAYSSFSQERKETLKENYNNLLKAIEKKKEEYMGRTSEKEYDIILRHAYCAQQANSMFSAELRKDMGLIREAAMANNTLWILNDVAKNKKAILWAHNVHIAKSEFEMTAEAGSIEGMGYILNQHLKKDMISIAAAFNEGEFVGGNQFFPPATENSLEGIFAKLDYDYFLLDISGNLRNSTICEVLNTPQSIRAQGFDMITIPNKSYDAFYFTKNICRVSPSEESLEKFEAMN